uniref:Peptidase M16 N-terminal domain-containing protein n=1 Tax=viral metagenome TaxID=1070528 RepID=A0A6C0D2Z6_9ZZZZ
MGSVYETDDCRGASHMIEHMCFKGTDHISKARNISIEYDKIGAEFNAYTTKRFTAFTVKCGDEFVEHSIDILSDMLFHSTFKKHEYDKERVVVVQESVNNKNSPQHEIVLRSDQLLYKGSSYEYPVDQLEYHKQANHLPYKEVVRLYRTFYIHSRMIISIVSNLSVQNIQKIVSASYFGVRDKDNSITDSPITDSPIHHTLLPQQDIQYSLIKKRGVNNTLVTIGFRTCGRDNSDRHSLEILKRVLAGTMSGRLFTILRGQYGLTYSSHITTDYHEETGDFLLFTQTESDFLMKDSGVLPLLVKMMMDLIKNGITEEELKTAKGNYKGVFLKDLENIDVQCEYNGNEVLMDSKRIVPYSKLYDTFYKNVSKEDVLAVIRKYFKRINMSICLLSEKLPDLQRVQKLFRDFP